MHGKKLLIDCRELTRENLRSHGLILLEVIPRLAQKLSLTLFSDVDIPQTILSLFPDKISTLTYGKKLTTSLSVFLYQKKISRLTKELYFDFFWEPNHYLLFDIAPTKSIVTIHDTFPLSSVCKSVRSKTIFKWGLQRTLKNADNIIVPSIFTLNNLENHFRGIFRSATVIPNGISEPCKIIPQKPELLKGNGNYILFIGRLSYWKGTDIILDYINNGLLLKDYSIVLAGSCDEEIEKEMENIKYNNAFQYLGFVNDSEKEYLYKNASLFIYPTRFDGFGLPPLEAALRKIPVLSSNIDVIREVTKNSGDYFELDKGVVSMARKIEEILRRSQDVKDKSTSRLLNVAQGYSWDNFSESFLKLLKTTSSLEIGS